MFLMTTGRYSLEGLHRTEINIIIQTQHKSTSESNPPTSILNHFALHYPALTRCKLAAYRKSISSQPNPHLQKSCHRMFCVAVSLTDMVEHFE